AVVEMRIIDQALPTHRGTRLFEVDAHHDDEVGLEALALRFEFVRVFERGLRVVNGTGADDNHQPVVGAMQHLVDLLAGGKGGLRGSLGGGEVLEDGFRRQQFLDFLDAHVVDDGFHFQIRQISYRIQHFTVRTGGKHASYMDAARPVCVAATGGNWVPVTPARRCGPGYAQIVIFG